MGVEASLQHAHGELEKKDGRVTGCIAVDDDGKYVRYNAKKGAGIERLRPMTRSVCGCRASSIL